MFLTIEQFVKDKLPYILAGQERQNVLLASYRAIGDYKSGPVETGDKNLSVTVQTGFDQYDVASTFAFAAGDPLLGADLMRDQSRTALQSVAQRVGESLPATDESLLAVVYLGLTAFDAATVFALNLKKRYPEAVIVTLTCDCDGSGKRQKLQPLVDSGAITYSLVTHECGGQGPMAAILRLIIAGWPVRSRD